MPTRVQDEELLHRVCREVAPYTMVPQAPLLFTLESALHGIELDARTNEQATRGLRLQHRDDRSTHLVGDQVRPLRLTPTAQN